MVLIDDLHGGRLIGEHLAAAGHRRVVFLHEPQQSPDYVSAGMLRSDGLAEHLELVAVPAEPDGSVDGRLPCLDADPSLTAVVANHDGLAARALRVLTSNGRRVPDDLAVIGYDDGELAEMSGLTTVAQPFAESGRMALEMVLSMVAGSSVPVSRVVLNPTLVLRGTG
ncbi:LacI family DNA-binding transcriptional regulator [Naumannella halotolerans]|uniref:LacI family DNA-binding transcriptional regulator n=1 Tax=Naumannella halotolerans TaxID=993414 RepID=UPI00141518B9|nr:substrate-binding domain-containing protein [Naumannella halotolerans]